MKHNEFPAEFMTEVVVEFLDVRQGRRATRRPGAMGDECVYRCHGPYMLCYRKRGMDKDEVMERRSDSVESEVESGLMGSRKNSGDRW
jgi:hypothetical protein